VYHLRVTNVQDWLGCICITKSKFYKDKGSFQLELRDGFRQYPVPDFANDIECRSVWHISQRCPKPSFCLRTPCTLLLLCLLLLQRALTGHFCVAGHAQCFRPSTKLPSNSRKAWVICVLEFCHIHMVSPYPYRNVTG
jgi:hypothetical protein